MFKYFLCLKISWQEYLEYRLNFLLEILGSILLTIVILFLWFFLYKQNPSSFSGQYNLKEIITYLIGANLLVSFFLSSQGDDINDDIKEGTVSNFLIKPLNPLFYWFFRDLAHRLQGFFLAILGYGVIIAVGFQYLLVPSLYSLLFTFVAIVFANILHYLLFSIFSLLAFWLDQTWGFRFVMRVIMEIATGAIIPLNLIPGLFGQIFQVLPFQFLAFFPMQIYLGKISLPTILSGILQEIFWLGILIGLAVLIWKRGLKHYSAVGG